MDKSKFNRVANDKQQLQRFANEAADRISELQEKSEAIEEIDEKLGSKADLIGGKVPASQLPSYVDDVIEYDSESAFPEEGEQGKIYVAKDTNLAYRWSGSRYVQIAAESPNVIAIDNVDLTSGKANAVLSPANWILASDDHKDCSIVIYATEGTKAIYPIGEFVELKRISRSDDKVIFGGSFANSNGDSSIIYNVTAAFTENTGLVSILELEANKELNGSEYPMLHNLTIGNETYLIPEGVEVISGYSQYQGSTLYMPLSESDMNKLAANPEKYMIRDLRYADNITRIETSSLFVYDGKTKAGAYYYKNISLANADQTVTGSSHGNPSYYCSLRISLMILGKSNSTSWQLFYDNLQRVIPGVYVDGVSNSTSLPARRIRMITGPGQGVKTYYIPSTQVNSSSASDAVTPIENLYIDYASYNPRKYYNPIRVYEYTSEASKLAALASGLQALPDLTEVYLHVDKDLLPSYAGRYHLTEVVDDDFYFTNFHHSNNEMQTAKFSASDASFVFSSIQIPKDDMPMSLGDLEFQEIEEDGMAFQGAVWDITEDTFDSLTGSTASDISFQFEGRTIVLRRASYSSSMVVYSSTIENLGYCLAIAQKEENAISGQIAIMPDLLLRLATIYVEEQRPEGYYILSIPALGENASYFIYRPVGLPEGSQLLDIFLNYMALSINSPYAPQFQPIYQCFDNDSAHMLMASWLDSRKAHIELAFVDGEPKAKIMGEETATVNLSTGEVNYGRTISYEDVVWEKE